jgi:hypothetical protein
MNLASDIYILVLEFNVFDFSPPQQFFRECFVLALIYSTCNIIRIHVQYLKHSSILRRHLQMEPLFTNLLLYCNIFIKEKNHKKYFKKNVIFFCCLLALVKGFVFCH